MYKKISLLFLVFVFAIALNACGPKPTPTPPPAAGGFDIKPFLGVYEGTWTNTTTGASGPAVITVEANEAEKTVTLTLDFGGNYLGLNDPPPFPLTAKYDDNGAAVRGESEILGKMDITIDTEGNIIGNLTDLIGGTIPSMTYTGKIGEGRLDTNYTVTLADGTVTVSELRTVRK
jgi:hypothetical protein